MKTCVTSLKPIDFTFEEDAHQVAARKMTEEESLHDSRNQTSTSGLSALSVWPNECLEYLLQLISWEDQVSMSLVCKEWRHVIKQFWLRSLDGKTDRKGK